MVQPLYFQLLDPLLQITARPVKQRPVPRIMAAFELLYHALQRQPETLFLPQSIRRFLCQARLFGQSAGLRLVLLRFDGFAFPAPGHRNDYNF
jgi:hypothetical protein